MTTTDPIQALFEALSAVFTSFFDVSGRLLSEGTGRVFVLIGCCRVLRGNHGKKSPGSCIELSE